MDKFCKTCAILASNAPVCQLKGIQVDPEVDYCSKYTTLLEKCEICGNGIISNNVIIDMTNKTPHIICGNCLHVLNSCRGCVHSQSCAFETDPSSLPKFVTKEIRQGNSVIVTQIRNPDRIEITCKKICPCFDPENECMRQNGSCGRHEDII